MTIKEEIKKQIRQKQEHIDMIMKDLEEFRLRRHQSETYSNSMRVECSISKSREYSAELDIPMGSFSSLDFPFNIDFVSNRDSNESMMADQAEEIMKRELYKNLSLLPKLRMELSSSFATA
ncbi:MAG: hypothetical protein ACTSSI_16975 [Candidatus Helarchaeota archaeon]